MIEKALEKLGISSLNEMQKSAIKAANNKDILLRSPTGSGKTLAFLLPVLTVLKPDLNKVQVLIIAPSRELALQIEQVFKKMGTGFKANCFYGGHAFQAEVNSLKEPPAVLVGTPGRIADHLKRQSFTTEHIQTIVLDEFDKALELGFQQDLESIFKSLPQLQKRILTSATQSVKIPDFAGLSNPEIINFIKETAPPKLKLKAVRAEENDKLEAVIRLLCLIGNHPTLIFCNHREAVERISELLKRRDIGHNVFHGGLEQPDRLKALVKFRNGTHKFLITTDLASRGLDIPEIENVIHYQLPASETAYIHRNGRTARMHAEGTSYLVLAENEAIPPYMDQAPEIINLDEVEEVPPPPSEWETLYLSGGKMDKISKMDIVGTIIQKGKLPKEDIGLIEVFDNASFVAIKRDKITDLVKKLRKEKIKKQVLKVEIAR